MYFTKYFLSKNEQKGVEEDNRPRRVCEDLHLGQYTSTN
jgi:hypothetical protein